MLLCGSSGIDTKLVTTEPIAASPILPGGIDFRVIDFLAQPMGSFSGLNFNLPKVNNLASWDLDKEMAQLKNMVQKGIVPPEERIKEYISACYQKGELEQRRADLITCIMDIWRLEEEGVVETKPALKEILVILDTV